MTISELTTLITLATKDLKEAVCTYQSERKKGYSYIPKSCTKTAIKRRITQIRTDLLELEQELDAE